MNKLIPILIAIPIAIAIAADSITIPVVNKAGVSTSGTSKPVNGYVESIRVDITGVSTGAVAVTIAGEQIYTNNAVTADITVRPRVTSVNSLGANTNVAQRVFCVQDPIVVTVLEAAPSTNSYSVIIKLDDK